MNFFSFLKIMRYIVSGGITTFVDLSLLYIFTDAFHIWYLLSAVFAFIIAFFVSFFMQKYWTFQDVSKEGIHKQMITYLLIALINLGINTLLMYIFVNTIHLHYMIAQFITAGLIAISSYFIYKKVIFKKAIILN